MATSRVVGSVRNTLRTAHPPPNGELRFKLGCGLAPGSERPGGGRRDRVNPCSSVAKFFVVFHADHSTPPKHKSRGRARAVAAAPPGPPNEITDWSDPSSRLDNTLTVTVHGTVLSIDVVG